MKTAYLPYSLKDKSNARIEAELGVKIKWRCGQLVVVDN